MGVDDGGHAKVVGDAVDEVVDDQRGLRVKARVGLIAEEVFRVEHNGARDGHTLLHTTRDFAGILIDGIQQSYAVQAELGAAFALVVVVVREHIQGKHHVLQHAHRVEEGCALEYHAHLAAQERALPLAQADKTATVVYDIAFRGFKQPHDTFHQNGFSRAALTDNQIRFSVFEGGIDVVEYVLVGERLIEVFQLYHDNICVRKRSENRIRMLLVTTASVLALPTSVEPPSTV